MNAARTVDAHGLRLVYTVSEPSAPAAGLPVVALHGWGASRALMTPMTERLAALGHTVYALDLPGFGETPAPPAPWGVEDYAACVASALTALNLPSVHLIGHSFGGRICMVLGADFADRVGKVVLVDSAGVPPKRSPVTQARQKTYRALRRALEAVGARRLAERLRGWYNGRYGSPDFQQTSGVMRETFVRVVNQDLRPFAARLRRPVLLFWGDGDEDTPLWQGRALEQIIPDAGLVVLEGAGHYSYLDRLDEFLRVTDYFLKQGNAPA